MFADTENTCLRHNDHVALCRVTRSLFFLHDWGISFNLLSIPERIWCSPRFLHIQSVWAHCYTNTTWLRFWGSGSLMLSQNDVLRLGWGWQPPQTTSWFLLGHLQRVWAQHWYAVHGHTVAALKRYPHTTWLRFCRASPARGGPERY